MDYNVGDQVPKSRLVGADLKRSRFEEAKEIVGFMPDIVFRITGVTFKNPDGKSRQDILRNAGQLLSRYGKIPIVLKLETENEYDEHAISVFIPSSDSPAGTITTWDQVGYVPVRYCPTCSTTWGGTIKDKRSCPACRTSYAKEGLSHLNKYIASIINAADLKEVRSDEKNKDSMEFGLLWISSGSEDKSIGAMIAMKFNEKSQ